MQNRPRKVSGNVLVRQLWVLQGVTGVTRGYKGLQGVTKDYRNFFLTRTFPDTFLALFCIKIKVEAISNF